MSDRMYIVCNDPICEKQGDKTLLCKNAGLGWYFYPSIEGGVTMIKADSKGELLAQLAVGGLNDKDKEDLMGIASFNKWLDVHLLCENFGIEMDI